MQKLCQLGNSIPSRTSACSPAKPSPAQPSLNGRWAGRAAPVQLGHRGALSGRRLMGWGLTKPTKSSNQPTSSAWTLFITLWDGLAIESYPGRSLGLMAAW